MGKRPLAPATLRALRRRAATADVVVAHGSRTLPACAIALAGAHAIRLPQHRRPGRLVGHRAPPSAHPVVPPPRRARHRPHRGRGRHLPGELRHRAEKITVIPSAVRAEDHQPATAEQRAAARLQFGVERDATVVAVVGALSEEKRPGLAVEAIAEIDGAHLLFAGDGPLRTEVATLGVRLAPGRVHVLGALADPSPVYDAADVLVLPSRTEGMPGVLIEAGTRVARGGDRRPWFTHGRTSRREIGSRRTARNDAWLSG